MTVRLRIFLEAYRAAFGVNTNCYKDLKILCLIAYRPYRLVPFLASWQSLLELSSSLCPATADLESAVRIFLEFLLTLTVPV